MSEYDGMIFPHPARVLQSTITDPQVLMQLACERHAWDSSVFRDHPPFFWPAEISSNRIDAYFTRMMPSSLFNYRNELDAGISFQNSHRWMELGFGRSLAGHMLDEADVRRVIGEFYTIPGLLLNGVRTDDFILGVRAGIAHDVSIGWYGGQVMCNICGRDMFRDWNCDHLPGFQYMIEAEGEEGAKERKLAVGHVENAHLAEVSSVYDGATPGAAIVKAQQEAQAGRLKPEAARMLEARYRIHIPGAEHLWAGIRIEGRGMPEEGMPANGTLPESGANPPPAEIEVDALNTRLVALGCPPVSDDPVIATRWVVEEIEQLRAFAEDCRMSIPAWVDQALDAPSAIETLAERVAVLSAENNGLKAEAVDGRQYREDLLAEALSEGVRAYGNGFDQAMYRELLKSAPLATIKRTREDWASVADRNFPAERQTVDREERKPEPGAPEIPAAAYQAA